MRNYEIGQEYYMGGVNEQMGVIRVEVVGVYPRCVVVQDKRGIKYGINRPSAHLDLYEKKGVIMRGHDKISK